MPGKLYKLLIAVLLLLAFCAAASGQKPAKLQKSEVKKQSPGEQLLGLTGKAAVIIVGQTAKAAWKTTKFTASDMAKPVAKAILLKAAPKLTVFALKLTGKAAVKALPIGKRLFLTYLKTRLSL
jgi:hypothetical protein